MNDSSADREPIVSEGRYAVVSGEGRAEPDFWLADEADGGRVPLDETDLDDAATVLSRFRNARTDREGTREKTELTCHECGKTWTYTGGDEHAACPNCETEVPVKGIGP